jgi:hypothetical protein
MAIDRGPWNALIDDDGSNLTGSIWNKAAIKSVLLDPIDALAANVVASAATGTVHNLACGPAAVQTEIRLYGNGDLTLTGLAFTTSPRNGDRVTLLKHGFSTGVVALAHENTSSTQYFSNMVTSAPTPLRAGGTAGYVFFDGVWFLTAHEQGTPVPIPFVAGNYAGQGTITAAMVVRHEYYIKGRVCLGWLVVSNFPGLTSANSLNIGGWPATLVGTTAGYVPGIGTLNGAWGTIMGEIVTPKIVQFVRSDFGNWTVGPHHIFWQGSWAIT